MSIRKKAEAMQKKTVEMQRAFRLPETETCIQDYSCALVRGMLRQGTMYISQNYVCFQSAFTDPEVIPLRSIVKLEKEKTLGIFQNAIHFETNEGDLYFSSLVHRDETFNLIDYLWNHPPTYVSLEVAKPAEIAPKAAPSKVPASFASDERFSGNGKGNPEAAGPAAPTMASKDYSRGGSESSGFSSGAWGTGGDGIVQEQATAEAPLVDTKTSRNALRIAMETKAIGAATLNELSNQAEQIDRIERHVENVHNNLEKSEKFIRGIESVGGSIKNAFSKDSKNPEFEKKDRSLALKKGTEYIDVEILRKLKSCHLAPALIRFGEDKWECIDPETQVAYKDATFKYEKVERIILRARHLHMDIRFKDKTQRFRLMSSYVQAITNEFSLRTERYKLQVVFEPGVRKFDYGTEAVRGNRLVIKTTGPTGEAAAPSSNANLFVRKSHTKTSDLVTGATVEVKKDLDKQDEDLDTISDILGDLSQMADIMSTEFDRQNEQLKQVNGRVDQAQERVFRANNRVTNML